MQLNFYEKMMIFIMSNAQETRTGNCYFIWSDLNLGIWLQNGHSKLLVEVKFGGGPKLAGKDSQVLITGRTSFGDSSLNRQSAKFKLPANISPYTVFDL